MLKKVGTKINKVLEAGAAVYFTIVFMIVALIFPIKATWMLITWLWNMF